ncbi:MAG: hypothetical protein NZ941_03260, partial [Candidatus Caldarchaeum sp.]|nr:hypothetical protein [Candidatus Caldarchaeum sp.]
SMRNGKILKGICRDMGKDKAQVVRTTRRSIAKAISKNPNERRVRERDPVFFAPTRATTDIAMLMTKLTTSNKMSILMMKGNISKK